MDTGKLEHPIASQARVCLNHFDQLRQDCRSNIEGQLLEEQHARFNLWASNLGVFQTSKFSLDFRLKEAPILADTILQLLETVSDNLLSLYHNDKARPLSEADDPAETATQSLGKEANHPRNRLSSSSDDSDSQLHLAHSDSHMVQEVVRHEIGAIITRLQRLSVAIRQSTKVGRNLRALDYKGKDVDAKRLLAELERFTESLIRSKFPAMEEELSRRIVATICMRRRRLSYQRDHHAKLYSGKGKIPEKSPATKDPVKPTEAPQKPSSTGAPIAEPLQPSPGNVAAPEQAPTIPETKASTIDERKAQSLAAKSIKKSQRAKSALQNSKLDFPRPPKPDVNSTDVECPYCQIILSEEEWSDVRVWRQHIIKDLEAYVCVLPNCFEPPQMFETPGSWLNHMRLPHAQQWYCSASLHESDGPIVFQKEENFRAHMHHSHPGTFTESQMPSLTRAALRSASPYFSECPFGDDFQYTETATESNGLFGSVSLQDHVVGHLKELALWSVLPIENAESDSLKSVSGKPEAEPRRLSQDFDVEEEAAVIVYPVNDDYSDDWSGWAYLGCHWAVSAPATEGLSGETLSMLVSDLRMALESRIHRKEDANLMFVCEQDIISVWRPSRPSGPLWKLANFMQWPSQYTTDLGTTQLEALSWLVWVGFWDFADETSQDKTVDSKEYDYICKKILGGNWPWSVDDFTRNWQHPTRDTRLRNLLLINLDKQHIFCPRIIHSHEYEVHEKRPWSVRLPFLETRDLGLSAFGYYSAELVAPSYLRGKDGNLNATATWITCKRVTDRKDGKVDNEIYFQNLLRSSTRKHEAIMMSLAIITNTIDCLFFYEYAPYHLSELLDGTCPGFESLLDEFGPEKLLGQVSEVAGALNFLHRELEISGTKYICAHRLLTPYRIVILDSKQTNADFPRLRWQLTGFECATAQAQSSVMRRVVDRFTPADQSAPSNNFWGESRYGPPEAFTHGQSLNKPSRDMWSFGCILAMVLAFMVNGPDGVRQLEDARATGGNYFFVTNSAVATSRPTSKSITEAPVLKFLRELHGEGGIRHKWIKEISELVRDLLGSDPKLRPTSMIVEDTLKRVKTLDRADKYFPQWAVPPTDQISITPRIVDISDQAQQDRLLAALPCVDAAAFNSYDNQHATLCVPDTRVDLLRLVTEWGDGNSSKCIFWLNGMAGTGKSTIARTVAQHFAVENRLGASFFFSRGSDDRGQARHFFSTMAVQMARTSPLIRTYICEAIANQPNIAHQAMIEQWTKLILQPMRTVRDRQPLPHPIIFVIDALDECDNPEDVRLILHLMATTQDLITLKLRVFITSRPETPIRLGFRDMPSIMHGDLTLHNVSRSVIEHDIRTFIEYELGQIRRERNIPVSWPSKQEIDLLVQDSNCLFIYAATACRYIQGSVFPERRLSNLVRGQAADGLSTRLLDRIYLQILRDFVAENSSDTERTEVTDQLRMVVGSIVVLAEPLSAAALSKLLFQHETAPIDTLYTTLAPLYSILSIPQDFESPIRLLHPSFRDFLLDQQRCPDEQFWVDPKLAHFKLAKNCLELMSKTLKENICELISPDSLASDIPEHYLVHCVPSPLQYACRYWVDHFQQSDLRLLSDRVVDLFLHEHLLHWLEALSVLRRSSEGIMMIIKLNSIIAPEQEGRLSSFLYDAKRFILRFGWILEKAPLQIYRSALVFSPRESKIRNRFLAQTLRWISALPEVEEQWGACRSTLEGHSNSVTVVVFSPDGQLLASGSGDRTVRLWDATTGEARGTLEGHSDRVGTVVFSPDGQLLASGSDDRTVRLWDATTGEGRNTLVGHLDSVSTVVFSPDGQLVASGSGDYTARLWEARTGAVGGMVEGHSDSVTAVVFSPDGRLLASGSVDNTVRLWDVDTGKPILSVVNETENLPSFSADGSYLNIGQKQIKTGLLLPKILRPTELPIRLSLDATRSWVSLANKNIFWLPPDRRPSVFVVQGGKIALGHSSGRITFLSFQI